MTDRVATTVGQARDHLWRTLQHRLARRREDGVALGVHQGVLVDYVRADGSPVRTHRAADLSLDSNGKIVVGDVLGIWPDSLTREQRDAVPIYLDAVQELTRLGVVRPVANSPTECFITHQGARALDADDTGFAIISERRVDAFATEFRNEPGFDTLLRHFREAIAAFSTGGLDLSATVMIGCCYEEALNQLASACARYGDRKAWAGPTLVPAENDLKQHLSGRYVSAARLERHCRGVLAPMLSGGPLAAFRAWVAGPMSCFHIVRTVRNEAGHPTGQTVPYEDIATYIALFTPFFRRVRALCTAVDQL